jgi:uncharacterized protein with PQ loop repeat
MKGTLSGQKPGSAALQVRMAFESDRLRTLRVRQSGDIDLEFYTILHFGYSLFYTFAIAIQLIIN